MATAVYLVHYKQSRKHHRHAVRVVTGSASHIRSLYRELDPQAIDVLAANAGIGFVLVRTWFGKDENCDRKLKRQKHHSRLWPVCNPGGYARRTSKMRP